MPSLAFCFLACVMCVTTISSLKISIPAEVNHPDYQCKLQGYLGLCLSPKTFNGYADCKNFECATALRGNARTHRAMPIERAARGTHCAENKVCYDGECIDLPRGVNMPRVLLKSDNLYFCYRPNSVRPSLG